MIALWSGKWRRELTKSGIPTTMMDKKETRNADILEWDY